MGRERKLGKLADLNQVILNVDNRPAKGAALRLIETLVHPLNRAEGKGGAPTGQGYGVLQPRIASSRLAERASRHER